MQTVKHLGYRFALDEDLSFSVIQEDDGYYGWCWSMVSDHKEGPFRTAEQAEARIREYAKNAYRVFI